MNIRKTPGLLLVALLILLFSMGCSPQKRPELGQGNPPAPTAPAPSRPMPTDPNQASRVAERLAGEARKVQGVDSASVVVTGSTAMVGVNLKPGADAAAVKSEVARVVSGADNRVKNVLVSTDPELNQRLVRISKGITEGRPVSSFSDEISELLKRLSPAAR